MFKSIVKYIQNRWSNSETLQKAVTTCIIICIYKTLSYIPILFIDTGLIPHFISETSSMNIISNNGIEKFSIISLGIMPYISSSILMQLLSSNIGSDMFRSLKKDNENGATQIEMYTKYLTIFISIIQGSHSLWNIFYMKIGGLNLVSTNIWLFFIVNLFTIVTGCLICVWLANLISKKGIGNGVNTIIFISIINESIKNNSGIFELFKQGFMSLHQLIMTIGFVVFLLVFTIIVDNSCYKIKIHPLGIERNDQMQYLKIKLNSSGIMTVILTRYIAYLPFLIKLILKKLGYLTNYMEYYLSFVSQNTVGNLIFLSILIIFTSLNYSNISLDIKEMTKQLQENNVMVTPYDQEIRPGLQTQKYITKMINNWINACVLLIIFIGSQIFCNYMNNSIGIPKVHIEGLSIMLAVSTAKSLFLSVFSRNYHNIVNSYYQSDKEDVDLKIQKLQQNKI